MSTIQHAVNVLAGAHHGVALTGAGISVESGIPPFRGKGGLWEKIDPVKYAHIDAFIRNPAEVWRVLFLDMYTQLSQASPNAAHLGLHRLEERGVLKTVITQNIDGLHQKAGNGDVIEFHGSFAVLRCSKCHAESDNGHISPEKLPPLCSCGGILRPDIVMFGEQIQTDNLMRAQLESTRCDVMMVIGTSATVEPAAYLPVIAKRSGAVIIEINPEPTPLTDRGISDIVLLGPAGKVMTELVEGVQKLGKKT